MFHCILNYFKMFTDNAHKIKFYFSDLVGKILQDFRNICTTFVAEEYIENGTSQLMASRMAATEVSALLMNCKFNIESLENVINRIQILRNITSRMHPEKTLPLVPIMQKVTRQLTGHELYHRLQPYMLTEKELQENHFPRPDGTGNTKFYHSERTNEEYFANDARRCVRCSNTFKNSCSFHWAKLATKQCGNSFEKHYKCCNGKVNSIGCTVAPYHVHHNNKFDTSGYKNTVFYPMSHMHLQVFSLDCKLIYTTAGMEVAQVTLINSECDVFYETFVKPDNQILDYNTRFSGIQESDLKNVTTSLRDVQDQRLRYISAHTILVGHSLECDLRSLKIVHSNVVDTSVLYARLSGNSYKTGLKKLAQDHLQMKIQDNPDGHDSKEDAIAAMKLVHHQLQQEAIENYYTPCKLRRRLEEILSLINY